MLALCCDYRVMTDGEKRNSWMCMNEVRAPPFGDRTGILNALIESRSILVHLGHRHSQPLLERRLVMQTCTGRSPWRATGSLRKRHWRRGSWITLFPEIRLRLFSTGRVNWLSQSTILQRVVHGVLSRWIQHFAIAPAPHN